MRGKGLGEPRVEVYPWTPWFFQISCDSERPFAIMKWTLSVVESAPTSLVTSMPEPLKWVSGLQRRAGEQPWPLWIKGQLQWGPCFFSYKLVFLHCWLQPNSLFSGDSTLTFPYWGGCSQIRARQLNYPWGVWGQVNTTPWSHLKWLRGCTQNLSPGRQDRMTQGEGS